MKRRMVLAFMAALVFCFGAFSCSKNDGGKELGTLLFSLCRAGKNESREGAVFYADEVTASQNDGLRVQSSEDFGFLYDGIFAPPVCYDRIENYAIRLSLDFSGFELHVIKCVNISDCEEVSAMLQRRVDKLQNAEIRDYAPEGYEICFTGATVYTKGRYVFLISTYDNEAVIKQIKRAV